MHEMLENRKAIIFDIDGTLLDSMGMWADIDREYLGKFEIERPDDLQRLIEGLSYYETAVFFKEYFHIPDTLEQIQQDWADMAFERYVHKIPFKTGAESFIREAHRRGIPMGIASSNSRELIEAMMDQRGMHGYFGTIETGGDYDNSKPAPDIYLGAAEHLGVAPEDCLVFEDIIAGIKAGKAAGMTVCAIWDEHSKETDSEKRELSDHFIHDFTGLWD
jgi:HAD superfamily hydrolase (TIGR01509 family)